MEEPLARLTVEQREDGTVHVSLVGEVDLSNAEDVERELMEAVASTHRVRLDLTGTEYLDSQGLRMLHHLAERHLQGAVDARVVVCRDSAAGDLLELVRLEDLMPIEWVPAPAT